MPLNHLDINKKVATNITKARESLGMSKGEFARRMGFHHTSRATILEQGGCGITVFMLYRISLVLKCDAEDLLGF